jgi:hypothetical protein
MNRDVDVGVKDLAWGVGEVSVDLDRRRRCCQQICGEQKQRKR